MVTEKGHPPAEPPKLAASSGTAGALSGTLPTATAALNCYHVILNDGLQFNNDVMCVIVLYS